MKNPSKTKTARIFANLTTQNRRPAKRRLKRKLTPMIITLKILAKKSQEFNRKVSNRKKKKIISRKETQQKPS